MRNLLPLWLDVGLLMIAWLAIAWRFAVAGKGGASRRLTESLTFAALALTLKTGVVYDVLVPHTGPTVLRAVIHGLCLGAVAGVIAMWLSVQGDVRNPRLVPALYLGSGVLLLLLVVLAAGAPRTGEQMESAPDGWALTYFAIFCLPTLAGLFLVLAECIRAWRHHRSRLVGVAATATYLFLVLDNFTVFAAVAVAALRDDHSLLDSRDVPNGVVFAVLVCVAAVVSAAAARRGAESQWTDPVTEMWLDLRRACPEVALSEPWSLRGREQRIRAVVESVDALAQLAPAISPASVQAVRDQTGAAEAVALAVVLQNLIETDGHRSFSHAGEGVLDKDTITEVAALSAVWEQARRLRASTPTAQCGEEGLSRGFARGATQTN